MGSKIKPVFRGRNCASAHRAALLLVISILFTPSPAIGDEGEDRIHQLSGEVQASINSGDFARASSLVDELVRLQRQAAEVDALWLAEGLNALGHVRASMRDLDGAEAAFVEAHQLYSDRLGPLNPFSGLMLFSLASVFIGRGDLVKAVLAADRAVDLLPSADPRIALTCAGIYQAAGEWDKARSMLELAIQLAPDDPVVSNDLAWVLLSSPDAGPDDFQRAVQLARSSVAKRPDSLAAADTLGLALIRVGRDGEALETLQKVLDAPPDALGASRVVTEFHTALALERSGNPVRAMKLAQSSVDGAVPHVFDPAPAKDLLARLTSRLPEHSGRLDDVR